MYESISVIAAIQGRMDEIMGQLDAIEKAANGRSLTPAQSAQWSALENEHEFRTKEIRSEHLRASRAKYQSVQVSHSLGGRTAIPDNIGRASTGEVRDSAMALLESREHGRHLSADQRTQFADLIEKRTGDLDGDKIARAALATSRPEYARAFQKVCVTGIPAFEPEEARAINEVRALGLSAGSAGAFAVPVLVDPTIILTSQGSPNDILSLSRVETITTDKWTGLSSAGVTWRWGSEASESTDGTPVLAQPQIVARKADGFIPYSIEIEQDWSSFAADISRLLADGFSELVAEALTTGTNGSSQPDGLIASLDALTSPANLAVTTAGTLGAGDLYDLWDALPNKYRMRPNTVFLSSTDVQNTVRQLGTTDPNFSVNITSEGIPSFFGRRYITNDFMADMPTGTGNQPLLAVGDLKGGYLVASRAGMAIEVVSHLLGSNRRPNGQRGFYAYARVGAGVTDPSAFRLLVNKPT